MWQRLSKMWTKKTWPFAMQSAQIFVTLFLLQNNLVTRTHVRGGGNTSRKGATLLGAEGSTWQVVDVLTQDTAVSSWTVAGRKASCSRTSNVTRVDIVGQEGEGCDEGDDWSKLIHFSFCSCRVTGWTWKVGGLVWSASWQCKLQVALERESGSCSWRRRFELVMLTGVLKMSFYVKWWGWIYFCFRRTLNIHFICLGFTDSFFHCISFR